MKNFSAYEDKVIHCRTTEESRNLLTALEEAGYEYAIPICPLSEFVDDEFIAEVGEECYWRICETRGVAFNSDVNHWLSYGYEVLEYEDIKDTFDKEGDE